MKVWELIAKLEKMPAGAEMNIEVFRDGKDDSNWIMSLNDHVELDKCGEMIVVLHVELRDFQYALEHLAKERE